MNHEAKSIYHGRASCKRHQGNSQTGFQADGFQVIVEKHVIAECEDSEVADFICKAWNNEMSETVCKHCHDEIVRDGVFWHSARMGTLCDRNTKGVHEPYIEKCNEPVEPVIPRLGMYKSCVLIKGHEGEHRSGGTCNKHGYYIGSVCPHYPDCEPSVNYIAEATPVEPGTPTCQVCGALATKSASGWICKAHAKHIKISSSPAPQAPAVVIPKTAFDESLSEEGYAWAAIIRWAFDRTPDAAKAIQKLSSEVVEARTVVAEIATLRAQIEIAHKEGLFALGCTDSFTCGSGKTHQKSEMEVLGNKCWYCEIASLRAQLEEAVHEANEARRQRDFVLGTDKHKHIVAEAKRNGATEMLNSIRALLAARAKGQVSGGDVEVMKSVDLIVQNACDEIWNEAIEKAARIGYDQACKSGKSWPNEIEIAIRSLSKESGRAGGEG